MTTPTARPELVASTRPPPTARSWRCPAARPATTSPPAGSCCGTGWGAGRRAPPTGCAPPRP